MWFDSAGIDGLVRTMTTSWGAPREPRFPSAPMTANWGATHHGYSLVLAITLGDDDGLNRLWERVVSADGETDLLVALGAQARLAARTAATATGKPFGVPDEAWERIACADVRDFALAAYAGERARKPAPACPRCLRMAAEMLARLQVAAMEAVGLPQEWLVEVCAQTAAQARERP